MNSIASSSLVPMLSLSGGFLAAYSTGVVYLFTRKVNGRRRRWVPLDFVWVPMGGLTGVLIVMLALQNW